MNLLQRKTHKKLSGKNRRQIKHNWTENKLKHIIKDISPNEVERDRKYQRVVMSYKKKTELSGTKYE